MRSPGYGSSLSSRSTSNVITSCHISGSKSPQVFVESESYKISSAWRLCPIASNIWGIEPHLFVTIWNPEICSPVPSSSSHNRSSAFRASPINSIGWVSKVPVVGIKVSAGKDIHGVAINPIVAYSKIFDTYVWSVCNPGLFAIFIGLGPHGVSVQ